VGTREVARLGHGLDHNEIGVVVDEAGAGLAAIVDVRLVYDHEALRPGLTDARHLVGGDHEAGGRVGVGDDYVLPGHAECVNIEGEVIVQGDLAKAHAKGVAVVAIEAVGHVGKAHAGIVAKEGEEEEGEHLVGAVAAEDVIRRGANGARDRLADGHAVWVGVAAKTLDEPGICEGLGHLGRGRDARLVCVEFDVGAVLGLLTRLVGMDVGVACVEERAAHVLLPVRRSGLSCLVRWCVRLGLLCLRVVPAALLLEGAAEPRDGVEPLPEIIGVVGVGVADPHAPWLLEGVTRGDEGAGGLGGDLLGRGLTVLGGGAQPY